MATPEELNHRLMQGYAMCGNCLAYVGEKCVIDPARVFYNTETNETVTAWPQPEPTDTCLSHIPQHEA